MMSMFDQLVGSYSDIISNTNASAGKTTVECDPLSRQALYLLVGAVETHVIVRDELLLAGHAVARIEVSACSLIECIRRACVIRPSLACDRIWVLPGQKARKKEDE